MEMFIQATVNGIIAAGLYALVAYGLLIVLGIMNVVNFAHGEFVMIGAYFSYWAFIATGVDPLLLALPVALVMFLCGIAVYKFSVGPVLREPSINQLVLTFGISLTLQNVALLLWNADLRSINVPYADLSFRIGFVDIGVFRVAAFLLACLSIGILQFTTHYTRFGKAMQAVSQNKVASSLVG